ncbi:MAG: hypothetical protein ACD_35C00088G0002 [uncultured bacterium]|nr:MAG: hypothetical protein ACD_35C00088G0002 [uncultured bacterium]HCS39644.1 hypothetical protein [Anaerolineaceae bacterium]
MSDQPVSKKKKRGAPLGNTNAMLHGKSNVTFQDLLTKRGAPFGNSNAMTHGFYSSRLSSKHVAGLADINPDSLQNEIELMRVFTRLVAEYGAGVSDLDSARAVLLTLSHAAATINRLVRTQAFIPDEKLHPDFLLEEAIEHVKQQCPELVDVYEQLLPPQILSNLENDS